ncbi:MAG TPA: arsenite methyltransferase [Aggregatilineales bacterium]|nr:arsenite methyltransferase [Anaerolineales bacterium]HRE49550.1 arsenite methyltransferase [Aggregatilineales bacterium]
MSDGTTIDPNAIRESVSARYGALAENRTSNVVGAVCCGDGACCAENGCGSPLYGATMLEGVPSEAVQMSLGCGDPVGIASLQAGETVLDLGSGAGIDCFLAAKRVGETGKVIGVDMTPAMLTKANANKATAGVSNVDFRLGTIEALPVADASVDVILSNCVINLSPEKPAVFREAFRVLKSGGRVSISDIVTDGEFTPEQRRDMDQWTACLTGAIDVQDYTRLMAEAGFVAIEVVDKTDPGALIDRKPGMPHIFSARITARKP